MIQGFHHTSFTVSDVDAAGRFFIDLFGMERIGGGLYDFDYIRRQVGYPDAVLKIAVLALPTATGSTPSHRLELIEYYTPRCEPVDTATCRPGAAHLCFQVDDIQAAYERLCESGVRFTSLPNEITFGINKGAWAVYFQGPDGIALELFQPAPIPPVGEII
jgi:catechol 2,3-dioxygenase-like lactoylglutathione lyase family enzyme